MTVTIKNFGNDTIVNSAEELKAALLRDYCPKSVSLVTKSPIGMKKVTFINVTEENGQLKVTDTYKEHEINIDEFYKLEVNNPAS